MNWRWLLSRKTGLSIAEAIICALRGQLRREEGRSSVSRLAARLMEIGRHCAALPDLDRRTADEILGYDEHGAW
jgi:antitoxin VapB